MTQTAYLSSDSPRVCPNCAADIEDFDAYVGGVDRVCQVCLIDLQAGEGRLHARRRRLRVRRRRGPSGAARVTFPFESL